MKESEIMAQRERDTTDQLKKKYEEALLREQELSNYKAQMEPKMRLTLEKLREVEANLQDTSDELAHVKNQLILVTNQAQSYKKYSYLVSCLTF
jgi:hypothetical protein